MVLQRGLQFVRSKNFFYILCFIQLLLTYFLLAVNELRLLNYLILLTGFSKKLLTARCYIA